MPGELKVLTDRLLAMMNTYRGYDAPTDGSSLHGLRYKSDSDKKFIVISSCAYTEVDLVYKSLKCELDFIAGENSYTPIFVPQLKTLIDLKNQAKIDRFLKKYKDAGIEFKNEG